MRPIVITGGGTAGHVFPMKAIADALGDAGIAPENIRYVGSRRGQESRLLGGDPVALTLLPGRGVQRSFAPRSVRDNVVALAALCGAGVAALYLMMRWRPRAVVSVGGYAALACGVAAVLTRRPLVLVDFDATPGATHRLLARVAQSRCVGFPSSDPRAVVTGTPLRHEIETLDRATHGYERPRGARFTLVVMTGSLGARSVNRAVVDLAHRWRARDDVTIVHISGNRDYEWCAAACHDLTEVALDYHLDAFADMTRWWPQADLAVCRAGAVTVAELCALGIPSVLVPLPKAPGDHQSQNAAVLETRGGAVVIGDADVTGERLADVVGSLLDEDVLNTMGEAARTLARPGAAAAIAREIVRVAS